MSGRGAGGQKGGWGGVPIEMGGTRRIGVVPVWDGVGPVTRFSSKVDPPQVLSGPLLGAFWDSHEMVPSGL